MPNLQPLNQILPPQQPQYQPQQPQYQPQQPQYQPQPYQEPMQPQYQPPAPGQISIVPLTSQQQLDMMQNNGRVEVVIQDRSRGMMVLSADQLNIAQVAQSNPGLGQELQMFDTNGDGWLVENELKTTAVGTAPQKAGGFEHVASTTLGGGLFGLAAGTVAAKLGWDIAGKVGAKFGVKGWIAAAGIGAAAGLVGGLLTKDKAPTDGQAAPVNGYRPDTQWNQGRLAKTVL